jgi:hypothetical protein
MVSLIRTVDDATFGFAQTTIDVVKAAKLADPFTVVEGGIDHVSQVSNIGYFITWCIKSAKEVSTFFEASSFLSLVVPAAVALALATLGEIVSCLLVIKESIVSIRQFSFHTIFRNHYLKGKGLAFALKEVADYKDSKLKKCLPLWLYNDIHAKGGKQYLKNLIAKINAGDAAGIDEGIALLEKMRIYSIKKMAVSIVAWIGAALGVIGFLGLITIFPPAAIAGILLWISIMLTVTQIALRKGVVENPDGGFSFLRCFPMFFQNWWNEKPVNLELPITVDPALCGPVRYNGIKV